MKDDIQSEHQQRDAESFIIIGSFFVILAIIVLIGTIWSETVPAAVINVSSGVILLAIGLGGVFWGLHIKRKRFRTP
jgi:uncharacterized integral membrane protein